MLRITAAGEQSRVIDFQREKMMKNVSVWTIWGIIFCALVFSLAGCSGYYAQPGETAAEGHRRHLRNLSVNHQNMMRDLDVFWLSDEPSKATIMRVE
jgi:hypothetical protein